MKKIIVIISCILLLSSFLSCGENAFLTEVKILNISSYDLNISFDLVKRWYEDEELTLEHYVILEQFALDLKKGKSTSFEMRDSMTATYRTPNDEIEKIVFLNLENGELINEVENDNLFILTKKEPYNSPYGGEHVWFLLEVDDKLLLK